MPTMRRATRPGRAPRRRASSSRILPSPGRARRPRARSPAEPAHPSTRADRRPIARRAVRATLPARACAASSPWRRARRAAPRSRWGRALRSSAGRAPCAARPAASAAGGTAYAGPRAAPARSHPSRRTPRAPRTARAHAGGRLLAAHCATGCGRPSRAAAHRTAVMGGMLERDDQRVLRQIRGRMRVADELTGDPAQEAGVGQKLLRRFRSGLRVQGLCPAPC